MLKKLKRKFNNKGSAMLVAIVVSIVVIAFCISLLLVSYVLFSSAVRKSTQTQCREVCKSVSIELEKEITTPNFNNWNEQDEAKTNGKYPLYFYLRENMHNEKWPYYGGNDVAYHTQRYAYRYFDLSVNGGDFSKYMHMADDISVCIYWTPEVMEDFEDHDNATVTIVVTSTKGDQKCTITSRYTVTVLKATDAAGQEQEIWKFGLEERE